MPSSMKEGRSSGEPRKVDCGPSGSAEIRPSSPPPSRAVDLTSSARGTFSVRASGNSLANTSHSRDPVQERSTMVCMKPPMLRCLILLLGVVALASSWLSIRPASAHRYAQLQAREADAPESVTAEEWIMSKDDEGMTALSLLIIGIPSSIALTLAVVIWTRSSRDWRKGAFPLGVAWILLGGALHALAWSG